MLLLVCALRLRRFSQCVGISLTYTHAVAQELRRAQNPRNYAILASYGREAMRGRWWSDDFTLSKRHLGVLLIALGVGAVVLALAPWLLGRDPEGIGGLQTIAIGGGLVLALLGGTLWPLGDMPA